VALAYFLGSDYTEGVSGVGIVNAMEVLEAFSMQSAHPSTEQRSDTDRSVADTLHGLRQFKEWLQGYDFTSEVLLLENATKMATCSDDGGSLELQSLSESQRKLVSLSAIEQLPVTIQYM